MKSILRRSVQILPVVLLAALIAAATAREADSGSDTTAGFARIDITPRVPVRMVGYSSREYEGQPAENKLFARAVAIGNTKGELGALMITADLLGIPRSLRERVLAGLESEIGISAEKFAISATHTHGGPSLSGYMQDMHFSKRLPEEEKGRIDEYTDWLVERLIEIGVEASKSREPAILRWGEGRAGFAMNRRVIKDGKWAGMRPNPGGSVDLSLPVLTATSVDDEERVLGVFLSYACHCTSYASPKDSFHGDWAGAAAATIESRYPGSVALVAAGCGADANPHPRVADAAPYIEKHGVEIADVVDGLLGDETLTFQLSALPTCKLRPVQLPLAVTPDREEFEKWVAGSDKRRSFYGQVWLDRLDSGVAVPEEIDYLVQTWQFPGMNQKGVTLAFLPGEVTSGYSLRIKKELNTSEQSHWVIAYANESPGYITTAKEIGEGGYEVDISMVYYDQPSRLAPETEDIIVNTVVDLAGGHPDKPSISREVPPRPRPQSAPLPTAEALASMHVKDGFSIELVASEPLVMDPVAFDWGPDGRLWVVEMRDYPNGLTWNGLDDPLHAPGGRVKVLTDLDGDGQYDKAEVFLDNLPYPTGVKVWDKGILITAAPNIIYAEDTDGDDKADHEEIWYEGFAKSNQQHRVNGLAWGLDNTLHVANGDGGGVILSKETRDEVDIRGNDLRIDPFTKAHEPLSGRTQCGRFRDDWGNWFGCNNSNPLWHYPMKYSLLKRNDAVSPPSATVSVPIEPGASPVFPLSETLERFNQPDRANRFTSVCGPTIFRDSSFGASFEGNVFICEPVHNLVSRQVVNPNGATFTSERAFDEKDSEFLASTDNWSRPVAVRTGPDGALWVADMYRLVIEHPEWIPLEFQEKYDLRAGSDLGRIYRIFPQGRNPGGIPKLDDLSNLELVGELENPNGTTRDLVHQMLLWRGAGDVVPALTKMVKEGEAPTARLHALSVLEGLGKIDPAHCRIALRDAHPGVVKNGIRIAASHLTADEIVAATKGWMTDPPVAQELAGVLGELAGDISHRTLAAILLLHRDEPYVSATAFSSVNPENLAPIVELLSLAYADGAAFAEAFVGFPTVKAPLNTQIETFASMASRWDVKAATDTLVSTLAAAGETTQLWQFSILIGLLENGADFEDLSPDPGVQQTLKNLVAAARAVAGNATLPEWQQLVAIRLLKCPAVFDVNIDLDLFADRISPQYPERIRTAAFEVLGNSTDPLVAEQLIERWASLSPLDRTRTLKLLLSRSEWTNLFVSSLEDQSIPVAQIDAATRQRLLDSSDESLQGRSEALFQTASNPSRAQVLEDHAEVLEIEGDPVLGKSVFAAACIACHALDGIGNAIGPDLAAVTNRAPESMLVAILDPNRAVEDKYMNYSISTKDGSQLFGLISEESAGSITLRTADGSERNLLRADIEAMQSAGISMMPDGLEATLTKPQMGDLLAYLSNLGSPTREPVLSARAGPNEDGVVELAASISRISGDRLEFMPDYNALGWWTSENDRAEWTVVLDRPGEYTVEWEYSVAPDAAGNQWQILVNGEPSLTGEVESTGSWETFKTAQLGELDLSGGDTNFVVRSVGKVEKALLDLRSIRLVPVK
jgi:putative membrane-bound dehydrogenase-like protein